MAAAAAAVLLIEDDPVIGRNLVAGLDAHGYRTTWARTAASALAQARVSDPEVVLLDLGLPDGDGIDLARSLRSQHPGVLIVILTARSDDIDVIVGLDAGADDYLTKPFSLTVLLARLRAHLRSRPILSLQDPSPLQVGDLLLDPASRRCHLGGRELTLRSKEFDLLAALASRPGVAVGREELMATVWDENWFGSTKTLDVTMAALRQRLATAGSGVRAPVITTLRGHGYRLEAEQQP
jgi:DNA-binding response OmpR family regulator